MKLTDELFRLALCGNNFIVCILFHESRFLDFCAANLSVCILGYEAHWQPASSQAARRPAVICATFVFASCVACAFAGAHTMWPLVLGVTFAIVIAIPMCTRVRVCAHACACMGINLSLDEQINGQASRTCRSWLCVCVCGVCVCGWVGSS